MDTNFRPSKPKKTSYGLIAAKRILSVLAVFIIYYIIQYLTRVIHIYPYLDLQDEWWVKSFDHHFIQMICGLLLIGILSKGHWHRWGLNLLNYKKSIKILKRFLLYYGVYFIGIGFVIQLLFLPPLYVTQELTAQNIVGKLAFGFLFVGLSEEILFRGLFHSFLAGFWAGIIRWRSIEFPVAGVVTTIIFTVAHIGFNFNPFEITHLSVPQLLLAFVLGLFYSWTYYHTNSLLTPILAHNLSDGLLWVSEYLLIWWYT